MIYINSGIFPVAVTTQSACHFRRFTSHSQPPPPHPRHVHIVVRNFIRGHRPTLLLLHSPTVTPSPWKSVVTANSHYPISRVSRTVSPIRRGTLSRCNYNTVQTISLRCFPRRCLQDAPIFYYSPHLLSPYCAPRHSQFAPLSVSFLYFSTRLSPPRTPSLFLIVSTFFPRIFHIPFHRSLIFSFFFFGTFFVTPSLHLFPSRQLANFLCESVSNFSFPSLSTLLLSFCFFRVLLSCFHCSLFLRIYSKLARDRY